MLKKITSINIIVFIIMGVFASAETQLYLIQKEKDYIFESDETGIVAAVKGREIPEEIGGKNNDILLSIINKPINAVGESKMQALILDATLHAERKVTFSTIMDMHGKKIFGVIFLLFGILLFNVISNTRTNQRLRAKNKRNEMLSQASNEYLYEYFAKHDRLELSEKFTHLFGTQKQLKEVGDILKNTILKNNLSGNIPKIRLPLADGRMGTFKSIGLNIHDDEGRLDFIVGKIIDISEEIEEKEKLIIKSKIDGLTGLYNAITTKELINENIRNKGNRETDALTIVDCDNLKYINDTYGHLTGDRVLKNISTALKLTFRQNDIIGRVGGDEFCIYTKNIPSISLIKSKCDQLNELIQEINEDFYVSVSSGMALLRKEGTYEELFEKADKVLYEAKKKKGIQSTEHSNF